MMKHNSDRQQIPLNMSSHAFPVICFDFLFRLFGKWGKTLYSVVLVLFLFFAFHIKLGFTNSHWNGSCVILYFLKFFEKK